MNSTKDGKAIAFKAMLAVGILLLIVAAHAFRLGTCLDGKLYIYYYSYFSDIALPFGVYFLLCMNDRTIALLKKWYVKWGIVFGLPAIAESLQGLGIECLGVTFDPVDYLMYAIGATLAAALDRIVFRRLWFW